MNRHGLCKFQLQRGGAQLWLSVESGAFYLVNDSLESGGVVEGEVGEHLAVDLDT